MPRLIEDLGFDGGHGAMTSAKRYAQLLKDVRVGKSHTIDANARAIDSKVQARPYGPSGAVCVALASLLGH